MDHHGRSNQQRRIQVRHALHRLRTYVQRDYAGDLTEVVLALVDNFAWNAAPAAAPDPVSVLTAPQAAMLQACAAGYDGLCATEDRLRLLELGFIAPTALTVGNLALPSFTVTTKGQEYIAQVVGFLHAWGDRQPKPGEAWPERPAQRTTSPEDRDARLAQLRAQIWKTQRDQRAEMSPNVAVTLIDRLRAAERVVAAADAWCEASPIKSTPDIPELKALVEAIQAQEKLIAKLEDDDDHTLRSENR